MCNKMWMDTNTDLDLPLHAASKVTLRHRVTTHSVTDPSVLQLTGSRALTVPTVINLHRSESRCSPVWSRWKDEGGRPGTENSNPVHVASVEVAARTPFLLGFVYSQFRCSSTRRPGIVATARVLPLVVAVITHRGGSLVMMNPVGKDAGQDREHGTLTDSEWAVVLSYSECFRSDM
ncbi:hypothetical protein B0H13DRAFT_2274586 [Mycena leptocephala]|nr:hypothetical protein B0H13DRAFT_2274586 [Mycena leptocephala]